jgi:hypothetical protein
MVPGSCTFEKCELQFGNQFTKKLNFQSSIVYFDLETALKYNRNVDDDTSTVGCMQSLSFTEFACKSINMKKGEIDLLSNNAYVHLFNVYSWTFPLFFLF